MLIERKQTFENRKMEKNKTSVSYDLTSRHSQSPSKPMANFSIMNLFSDLNMTYSRLTEPIQDAVVNTENIPLYVQLQRLTSENHQSNSQKQQKPSPEQLHQNSQCPNCVMWQQFVRTIEKYLLDLQSVFVAKQLELNKKNILLSGELMKKDDSLCKLQKFYEQKSQEHKQLVEKIQQQLRKKQIEIEKIHSDSKTGGNNPRINFKRTSDTWNLSDKGTTATNRNALHNNEQSARFYDDDSDKFELSSSSRREVLIGQSHDQSDRLKKVQDTDRVDEKVQIPREQAVCQACRQTVPRNGHKRNFTGKVLTVNARDLRASTEDYQVSKLRFENQNLNSYNKVLLRKIKGKGLEQRVFL